MAKESSADKEARRAEKKAAKEAKRAEKDGVHKSKKGKKTALAESAAANENVATVVLNEIEAEKPGSVVITENGDIEARLQPNPPPLAALVPFANPLADEKVQKKVLKSVKKAAKQKCLKRGVKEVVKSLRKSPVSDAAAAHTSPAGVVILAADISPMDVISHIPVLCEDHNIPYIFVPSRAELGAAGSTKRPTSVIMVSKSRMTGKKKEVEAKKEGADEEDFGEVYDDLVKVVAKASRSVKI